MAVRNAVNAPDMKLRSAQSRQRLRDRKRVSARRSLLETLEQRQLLAVGPQLIGIQPSSGALLADGGVLNQSPSELIFRFDDNTSLDASTLSAIRVVRAGADGAFSTAAGGTDFGTQGLVFVQFTATRPGAEGAGTSIVFTAENRASGPVPEVEVNGSTVLVSLNSNPQQVTRVSDLLQALDTPEVRDVLTARQTVGQGFAPIGTALPAGGLTVDLVGAERFQEVTDLGVSNVRLRIAGRVEGQSIQLNVTARDLSFGGSPIVTVPDPAAGQTVRTINVVVNSNSSTPTTVGQFVAALQNNPRSNALVELLLEGGNPAAAVGNPDLFAPITLNESAADTDIAIEPGFIGLGDSPREVVLRFAERLPQDLYRIEIRGAGEDALRNILGDPFEGGENFAVNFSLNTAPQVQAVVPRPVTRSGNTRTQRANEIWVYFDRNDPLDLPATTVGQNAALQQQVLNSFELVATRGTAGSSDDFSVRPTRVDYNSASGVARLHFSQDLADSGLYGNVAPGALRLRIGSANITVNNPAAFNVNADPADTFTGAVDLGSQFSPTAGGESSVVLTSEIRNTDPLNVDFPGASDEPGNRLLRPEDISRLDRPVPLDHLREGADDVDGITQIRFNFAERFRGDDPNTPGSDLDKIYLNLITEQQKQRVREALHLYSEYLGVQFVETEAMGIQIAVGDIHGADSAATSGQGGLAVATGRNPDGTDRFVAVDGPLNVAGGLDQVRSLGVLDFQDFDESDDDQFGGEFFRGAMFLIGQMIGYGYADELPDVTLNSGTSVLNGGANDPLFPAPADIIHGQHLFRPDSTDIDVYKFEVPVGGGRVTVETLAERLEQVSLLDTHLRLYQQVGDSFVEVAANGDYWSNDSQIDVELGGGTYFIAVSAAGNDEYDPIIAGTGFGGRSEGEYELRISYSPAENSTIQDTTGLPLDGDSDGKPGGFYDFWFEAARQDRTVFVSNDPLSAGTVRNGTLAAPFEHIDDALAAVRNREATASPVEVVRILPSVGADGDLTTADDNRAYEVGFSSGGSPLVDGFDFQVPKDVTVVIDAGTTIKLRRARIGVGSIDPTVDFSGGALQVLGTPVLVNATGALSTGGAASGRVTLTAVGDDFDDRVEPEQGETAGAWGGIDFRSDVDKADESRTNLEAEGVFLNAVQFADIRYGGGVILVGGQPEVISPIEMSNARPRISYNEITQSADSAMEATPDSFAETKFTTRTVLPGPDGIAGTTDDVPVESAAARVHIVGPHIHNNRLTGNSVNGLFLRTVTRDGEGLEQLTEQARFDDADIVHVLTENLELRGTPGGPISAVEGPPILLVTADGQAGGTLTEPAYAYRIVNVDINGNEGPASDPVIARLAAGEGQVSLNNLPAVPFGSAFEARRIYRAPATVATDGSVTFDGPFRRIATLNGNQPSFLDTGVAGQQQLVASQLELRQRLDARLAVDPSVVVKSSAALIEAQVGSQFLAEGRDGEEIIFTSLDDRRFGAGGTFNTNSAPPDQQFTPGDWAGLYFAPGSQGSLDRARVVGAGGAARIEGSLAGFSAIEVHQADVRIAHSSIESNEDGLPSSNDRVGRGSNASSTIFVRGAQPVIVDNIVQFNEGPALSFDLNSLDNSWVSDRGRSTGQLDRAFVALDNQGPLVRSNTLGGNLLNALEVRGGTLAVGGVWDDTDIVHAVRQTVEIPNQHTFGGLRLESAPDQSLVVKFADTRDADGNVVAPATIVAGGTFTTATGQLQDIEDRIGGSLQIVGQPNRPVVLTSLFDDSIGAGFDSAGRSLNRTARGDLSQQTTAAGTLELIQPDPLVSATATGNLGVASDGLGTDNTGTLSVDIPAGSTVLQAYLHVASRVTGDPNEFRPATIGFQNNQVPITWLNNVDDAFDGALQNFGTGRADVTTAVRAAVGAQGGTFNFTVDETVTGSPDNIEGTTLTVVYDNPQEPVRTVLILEGGLTTRQINSLTFSEPIDLSDPNFVAEMRLGISFSSPGSTNVGLGLPQTSFVTVNGQRMTSAAGGFDDGANADGQLITYGGTGDTNANPADPFATIDAAGNADDDEYYNLVPFLSQGSRELIVETENPSRNDSIFLATLLLDGVVELGQVAEPGDWNGLVIREGASDSNVATVVESEGNAARRLRPNDAPSQSQFIGELAPSITAASENRRMGFKVHGVLDGSRDLDVYSFDAEAGTEVWLDLDQTSSSLDAVVELVDTQGNVLALSDSSIDEELDAQRLRDFVSDRIDPEKVNPLRNRPIDDSPRSAFDSPQDLYSTNEKDPGLRVVLPGERGQVFTYQVRVRSSNVGVGQPADRLIQPGLVADGLTAGGYELNLRLQETDESAGTSISLADVRFAQTGISVIGQPLHSPLLGEDAEDVVRQPNGELDGDNDGQATAQPLGPLGPVSDSAQAALANLLASDRQAKSVSGTLSGVNDVDWYRFNVNYQNLTRDGLGMLLGTAFDIDYADGFARPDVSLWVFDSAGRLILGGTDSNVADDQPGSLENTDSSVLTRGSGGVADPYVGSIELAEGDYFVAVAGRDFIPQAVNQYYVENPSNPLIRFEPVESVRRIVEDHVTGGSSTAVAPQVSVLFDDNSVTPYTLNDVIAYGSDTSDNLRLFNPFTGRVYGTTLGRFSGPGATGSQTTFGHAFRADGSLRGYFFDNAAGNDAGLTYQAIDTGFATLNTVGTSNLLTFEDGTGTADNTLNFEVASDNGFRVTALTFGNIGGGGESGYVAGFRTPGPGLDYSNNIIYEIDPDTGAFVGRSTTPIPEADAGAGTNIEEVGRIDTGTGVGFSASLGVTAATGLDASGQLVALIDDGDTFTLVDTGTGNTVRFEFDAGTEMRFGSNVAQGQFVRDQDLLIFPGAAPGGGALVIEFDTGPRITFNDPAVDGTRVRLTDESGVVHAFEFDSDGIAESSTTDGLPASQVTTLPVVAGETVAQSAQRLAAAINGTGGFAVQASAANTGEVVLDGLQTEPVTGGTGIAVQGNLGSNPANPDIPSGATVVTVSTDEAAASEDIAATVAATLRNNGLPAVVAGSRLNFGGSGVSMNVVSQAPSGTADAINTSFSTPGVTGNTRIALSVDATVAEIAQAVADAVTDSPNLQTGATISNNSILFDSARVTSADPPLRAGGVAPGGTVTGLALVGGDLYAVSTAGGLYRVQASELNDNFTGPRSNDNLGRYVATATDLLGLNFQSLQPGPAGISMLLNGVNTPLSQILFGATAAGEVYAFDTDGVLQPVFSGGRSSISTGLSFVGFDFATLDENLWHRTGQRGTDPGHGINATFNGTRGASPGGTSWYFGTEDDPDPANTFPVGINYPGGAHGEMISNPFSLAGYSGSDLPMLYFNYFLETDRGEDDTPGDRTDLDQDEFRVYLIDEFGNETALATNELVGTDQAFDGTDNWRQARVSLGDFAGQENLRLRVEFSTQGTRDGFGIGTTRLAAPGGADIVDGERVRLGGRTFEFVQDTTLTVPQGTTGQNLDGVQLTVGGTAYEIDTNGTLTDSSRTAISIAPTADALSIAAALRTTFAGLVRDGGDNRVIFVQPDGSDVPDGTVSLESAGSPLQLDGGDGVAGVPVFVDTTMTPNEVAQSLLDSVNDTFTSVPGQYSRRDNVLKLIDLPVGPTGPMTNVVRPVGLEYVNVRGNRDGEVGMARDNAWEGVYLDDFIIGFAERGEMVTGTVADDVFQAEQNPLTTPQNITAGPYQLEIRDSAEYATATNSGLFRAFDTNDRLLAGYTLQPGSAEDLRRAQAALPAGAPLTFSLSDGATTVTFEFVDVSNDPDAQADPGNVRIAYNPQAYNPRTGVVEAESSEAIAARIVEAINRSDVQLLLNVRALPSTGLDSKSQLGGNAVVPLASESDSARVRDNRVNLFGNAILDTTVIDDAVAAAGDINPLTVERSSSRGDQNRERNSQGVLLLDGVTVTDSAGYGIELDHGLDQDLLRPIDPAEDPAVVDPDGDGLVPGQDGVLDSDSDLARYPRNLVELNTPKIIPGVVVQNSTLAFNAAGGIHIMGAGGNDENSAPVVYDRLVNNTIFGGTAERGRIGLPLTADGVFFATGDPSFADAVVAYNSAAGGQAPATALQNPGVALGVPDGSAEPAVGVTPQRSVPLGRGGTMTVQFVNNRLTGSGDARPDLAIFERGLTEAVFVEVSVDGNQFTPLETVIGANNTIDIDQYGFTPNDRIAFVRLTDVSTGQPGDPAVGADIDAVGAITSVAADILTPGGVGVQLSGSVSPTLMNNAVVNSAVGVNYTLPPGVAPADILTAQRPELAATTFQRNTQDVSTNITRGNLARLPSDLKDLFVSPSGRLFTPALASDLVDSSIASLRDRPNLATVKGAIGLQQSPILAPVKDGNGTLRIDDPNHEVPGGSGQTVFIDRGALDRGDLAPPRASVAFPADVDPNASGVQVLEASPDFFEIRLRDGGEPADPDGGVGINDASVNADQVLLLQDGTPLLQGIDYRFGYDANTDTIRLTPLAGVWESDSIYTVRIVAANQNLLVGQPGDTFVDGQAFQIVDSSGQLSVFEFDRGITLTVPVGAGGVATVVDGDTIELFDGTATVTLEFDSALGVLTGNVPVAIPDNPSPADVSAALTEALNDIGINAQVFDLGDGRVQVLSANPLFSIDLSGTTITQTGAAGVSPGFGIRIPSVEGLPDGLQEGQQFSIRRGDGREQLFEISADLDVDPEAIPVLVTGNQTLDQVADAIASAINSAGLDLQAVNAGFGVVHIPDAPDVSLILGGSALQQVGVPGQDPSNRVEIQATADQSAEEIADQLEEVVTDANLTGVSAQRIGDRVLLSGAGSVTGVTALLVSAPTDLAGNRLAGDPQTGVVEFQIFLTSGDDYGDAPDPGYATLQTSNGPRHEIVAGLSLGMSVTPDADGVANDGDLDDGFTLAAGQTVLTGFGLNFSVSVNNATADPAFLNIWIDWDGDGVFENTTGLGGERIETNRMITAGRSPNVPLNLSTVVPGDAHNGEIYVRMRLSDRPLTDPTGFGGEGEVEDHAILVQSNPFSNGNLRWDVSGDGEVTPIDALLVINALNRLGESIPLDPAVDPPGPPFMDVTGDGQVTPLDALNVINRLNAIVGGGEGEGYLPASTGVLAPSRQLAHDTPVQTTVHLVAEDLSIDSMVDAPALMEEEDDDLLALLAADDDDRDEDKNEEDVDAIFEQGWI